MKTNSKILTLLTFLYIYLPVCIFLTGFTKIWVWVICISVGTYAVYCMYRDFKAENATVASPVIQWKMCMVAFLITVLICIFIGYGGIFLQAGDWPKHNAVLHDLINKSWPIYYTEHENSMLTYYLGQYLVPGLIGKIGYSVTKNQETGFCIANIAMAAWAIFGILLVYAGLVRVTRSNTWKKQLRCILILFFFSGALPFVQIVAKGIYGDDMFSLGSYHWLLIEGMNLQYRSNLVMLRWVYPQVIVIWLVCIYLYEHRKCVRDYVILVAPVLIFGTFSIIFTSVAAVGCAVFYFVTSKEKIKTLKNIFSISNLCTFLTFGLVEIFYYLGNLQVEKPDYLGFKVAEFDKGIAGIVVFELFMFGVYCFCVYREQKTNPLYYITIAALIIIPFFKMGLYNDFVMCVSIPALFMVMIFVISYLNNSKDTKAYTVRATIISIFLLVGAWYPFMEIKENVDAFCLSSSDNTMDFFKTLEKYTDRSSEDSVDLIYNYYTYDLDGKIFYEVFARKKIDQ